jgi:8-oxo-dGTP pyrophosphatase MutT (NUDIX family)
MNMYLGKEIDLSSENVNLEQLEKEVVNRTGKERSIWVKSATSRFNDATYALLKKFGFRFNEQPYARAVLEISTKVPPHPVWKLGAGGVVYDVITDKIAMIVEKYREGDKEMRRFKFPGGFVEKEAPWKAAIREVKEEIGIDTGLLDERPLAAVDTDKSGDMLTGPHYDEYIVYLLNPRSDSVRDTKTKLIKFELDGQEIEKATWVDMKEYLSQQKVSRQQEPVQRALRTIFKKQ